MSQPFFSDPPRPRDRGWKRRLRAIFGWWIIGGFVFLLLTLGIVFDWSERERSKRLAREGERMTCTVVSKRVSKGSKSSTYYVTIRSDSLPQWQTERVVDVSEYQSVAYGSKTVYYHDPGNLPEGISELERPRKESFGLLIFLSLLTSGLGLAILLSTRRLLREMDLFLNGIELVTRGPVDAQHVRIVHGDRTVDVKVPVGRNYFVQVGEPERVQGLVVLASPDLRRHVFPKLEDLPVERITRGGEARPTLAPAVRPASDAWNRWIRRKYGGSRVFSWIFGIGTTLLALATLLSGFEPGLIAVTLIAGFFFTVILLRYLRNYWRDRVLWREGEEIHAVVLGQSESKGTIFCRFTYTYQGREYRGSVSMGSAEAPLVAASPPGAPVVADRVVILVDPYRPSRCAVVPRTMSGS